MKILEFEIEPSSSEADDGSFNVRTGYRHGMESVLVEAMCNLAHSNQNFGRVVEEVYYRLMAERSGATVS